MALEKKINKSIKSKLFYITLSALFDCVILKKYNEDKLSLIFFLVIYSEFHEENN
jgi:hypothetical protein